MSDIAVRVAKRLCGAYEPDIGPHQYRILQRMINEGPLSGKELSQDLANYSKPSKKIQKFLERLLSRGYIQPTEAPPGTDRRIKYWDITNAGRQKFESQYSETSNMNPVFCPHCESNITQYWSANKPLKNCPMPWCGQPLPEKFPTYTYNTPPGTQFELNLEDEYVKGQ